MLTFVYRGVVGLVATCFFFNLSVDLLLTHYYIQLHYYSNKVATEHLKVTLSPVERLKTRKNTATIVNNFSK